VFVQDCLISVVVTDEEIGKERSRRRGICSRVTKGRLRKSVYARRLEGLNSAFGKHHNIRTIALPPDFCGGFDGALHLKGMRAVIAFIGTTAVEARYLVSHKNP
jgi:hypothetical protein